MLSTVHLMTIFETTRDSRGVGARTTWRAALIVLLAAAYNIAALIVDWRRAAPLVTAELALCACALSTHAPEAVYARALAACRRMCSCCTRLPRAASTALVLMLLSAHLLLLALLGATELRSWLPVLVLCVIIGGCAACSAARAHILWRTVGVALGLQS